MIPAWQCGIFLPSMKLLSNKGTLAMDIKFGRLWTCWDYQVDRACLRVNPHCRKQNWKTVRDDSLITSFQPLGLTISDFSLLVFLSYKSIFLFFLCHFEFSFTCNWTVPELILHLLTSQILFKKKKIAVSTLSFLCLMCTSKSFVSCNFNPKYSSGP